MRPVSFRLVILAALTNRLLKKALFYRKQRQTEAGPNAESAACSSESVQSWQRKPFFSSLLRPAGRSREIIVRIQTANGLPAEDNVFSRCHPPAILPAKSISIVGRDSG